MRGLRSGSPPVMRILLVPSDAKMRTSAEISSKEPNFAATLGKSRRVAIALGVETLAACVVSYYAFEAVVNGHSFPIGNYFLYVWLVCAVFFGALFGAGAFLRGQGGARSHWGASLLPAVFLSEGLNEAIHLSDYAHMIPAVAGRIVVGLVLYLILFRRESLRSGSLISFAALTGLGLVGFELLRLATS